MSILVITGVLLAATVKLVEEVTVPPGVVTRMAPVVAPAGTLTCISVAAGFTKNPVAETLLNDTAEAFEKLVPEISTVVPTDPEEGVKLVMVGAAADTVKLVADVAVPPAVVTRMAPVEEPAATVAVICVALFTTNDAAATLLNDTPVALVKLVPVMVTEVPTGPLLGVKLAMVGAAVGAVTVKSVAEMAKTEKPVTRIRPVVEPGATRAVTWVALMMEKLSDVVLLNEAD